MRALKLMLLVLLASVTLGTWAGTPDATLATNLAPIRLALPAPSFISVLVDDLSKDPHVEARPSHPRHPFLAPIGVTNLALHKPVSSSARNASASALARITDGEKDFVETNIVSLPAGKQWVEVDLGGPCRIYAIVIWHDERRVDIFKSVVVQTASDSEFKEGVVTLFNNDYENNLGFGRGSDQQYWETYEGKLVDAKGGTARYVRCYSMGTRRDPLNAYTEVEVWGLPIPAKQQEDPNGLYVTSEPKRGLEGRRTFRLGRFWKQSWLLNGDEPNMTWRATGVRSLKAFSFRSTSRRIRSQMGSPSSPL